MVSEPGSDAVSSERTRRRWDWAWVLIAGLLSSAYCTATAARVGVTYDEPTYLRFGTQGWRDDTNWRLVTLGVMPLPVDVQTYPLHLIENRTGVQPEVGMDPVSFRRMRAANLVFWWLLLVHVMLLGRAAGGSWAGRVALALVAADPTLLAHASLATTDIPLAAVVVTFAYHTLAGRGRGVALRVLVPGLLLGVAFLTKVSGLLYGVIALGVIEAWHLVASGRLSRPQGATAGAWARRAALVLLRSAAEAVAIGALALAVVGVYCGVDRGEDRPLGRVADWLEQHDANGELTKPTRALAEKYPTVPNAAVAVYFQYWHNNKGRGAFLFGEWHPEGVWYFFPALILVKTPLPVLLLAAAVLVTRSPAALNQLTVLALVMFLPTLLTHIPNGIRLILPVVAVGYAALAVALVRGWGRFGCRAGLAAAAVSAALALWVWPHGLCYVNQLGGGQSGAERAVADSNYDWGQGLPDLVRWYEANGRPAPGIRVWYYGDDPGVHDKPLELVRPETLPIVTGAEIKDVAGENLLAVGISVITIHPELNHAKTAALRWLKDRKPVGRTKTFLIYDLRGER